MKIVQQYTYTKKRLISTQKLDKTIWNRITEQIQLQITMPHGQQFTNICPWYRFTNVTNVYF